jgi:hypothetical protein
MFGVKGSYVAEMGNEGTGGGGFEKLKPGPSVGMADVGGHQRGRIMRGTTQVVAERGYVEVKVQEVVTVGGVSTGFS